MRPADVTITEDLSSIERAGRAIVYLTVEWSMQEIFTRSVWHTAREILFGLQWKVPIEFFAIQEDDPATMAWLAARGLPRAARGVGTLLWLEHGQIITEMIYPASVPPEGIVLKTRSLWNDTQAGPSRLLIVEGDLLCQDVDVIVNAWNRNIIPWWLLIPQGVSRAIKMGAGLAPFRELGRLGPIPLGGAVVTGAGRLPFKAIIHVAGINMLWRSSETSIRASVRSAMELAQSRGYRSIAFPLIGAGSGGGRPEHVLVFMHSELMKLKFDGEVRIVRFRPDVARRRRGS